MSTGGTTYGIPCGFNPILAEPEHAVDSLDLRAGTLSGNKTNRGCRIEEIDGDGIVDDVAKARGRHSPGVGVGVPVDVGEPIRFWVCRGRNR